MNFRQLRRGLLFRYASVGRTDKVQRTARIGQVVAKHAMKKLGSYVSGLIMLEIAHSEFTVETIVVLFGQAIVPGE